MQRVLFSHPLYNFMYHFQCRQNLDAQLQGMIELKAEKSL